MLSALLVLLELAAIWLQKTGPRTFADPLSSRCTVFGIRVLALDDRAAATRGRAVRRCRRLYGTPGRGGCELRPMVSVPFCGSADSSGNVRDARYTSRLRSFRASKHSISFFPPFAKAHATV